MFMGWSRLSEGDSEGRSWLDAAEAGLDTAPQSTAPAAGALAQAAPDRESRGPSLQAMVAVYRASVAQARGDVKGTVAHARRALGRPAGGRLPARRRRASEAAAWAAGDLGTAVDTFTEAVASLHAAGMVADELVGPSSWRTCGWHEDVPTRRGGSTSARWPRPRAIPAGALHHRRVNVGLADVLREQGNLDAAAEHLEVAPRARRASVTA